MSREVATSHHDDRLANSRSAIRVALVAPFGLRPKGTTIARALPIARVLAAQGAAVRLVVPPWDDPTRAEKVWTEDGVEIVHARVPRSPLSAAVVMLDLLRAIRTFRPHVVHVFKPIGYSGAVAAAGIRGWGLGVRRSSRPASPNPQPPTPNPLIVVDADDLEGSEGWAGRTELRLSGRMRGIQERATLRAAPAVTVASRWLRHYVARLGVPENRILYLPNGHDISHLLPLREGGGEGAAVVSRELRVASGRGGGGSRVTTPDSRLIWYTRFTEADPGRVARLLAPLFAFRPALRLRVIGDEVGVGDRARARAALAQMGIDAAVEWLDYDPTVEESLATADGASVAIYPLDDDVVNRARCPSKVPQLMALGVPLVAEAVGEVSAYLQGFEDECLAPPGDEAGFRQRVEALLEEPALRSDVSERLRLRAAPWRWERVAGDLLAWYQERSIAPA